MEKKILWAVSFALVFILWIKVGAFKDEQEAPNNAVKPSANQEKTKPKSDVQVKTAEKNQKSKTPPAEQEASDATTEEKKYYKSHPVNKNTPDFAAITDVKARKKAFFEFLTPFVNEKNSLILKDRQRLADLMKSDKALSAKNSKWVSMLRKDHKLDTLDTYTKDDLNALLNRMDIIPVSLVLAQAANESAWGTSRFATQGNNFFGQWCFRKGCGLVPESRDSDADHEVRKFNDARESVFAYIDNLNTNAAYKKLRAIRLDMRNNKQTITGLSLVHGLEHYSERGQAYVEEIEGLINYNKLWRFNRNPPKAES